METPQNNDHEQQARCGSADAACSADLLRGALNVLTVARQRLLAKAQGMEYGSARIGVGIARSELGLLMDELQLKRDPEDLTIDLMVSWSIPPNSSISRESP